MPDPILRQPPIERNFMVGVMLVRERQKITQYDLSKALKVAPSTISNIEMGVQRLNFSHAIFFSTQLGTSIDDLVKIGRAYRQRMAELAGRKIDDG